MSKKQTEFERYDRMKKLEKGIEAERRKNNDIIFDDEKKRGKKVKTLDHASKKSWAYDYDSGELDLEYSNA